MKLEVTMLPKKSEKTQSERKGLKVEKEGLKEA
jgi:hypothetical protein